MWLWSKYVTGVGFEIPKNSGCSQCALSFQFVGQVWATVPVPCLPACLLPHSPLWGWWTLITLELQTPIKPPLLWVSVVTVFHHRNRKITNIKLIPHMEYCCDKSNYVALVCVVCFPVIFSFLFYCIWGFWFWFWINVEDFETFDEKKSYCCMKKLMGHLRKSIKDHSAKSHVNSKDFK